MQLYESTCKFVAETWHHIHQAEQSAVIMHADGECYLHNCSTQNGYNMTCMA